jgi:hypothetical protein
MTSRESYRIFGFWTGINAMPESRLACWESFSKTGLKPILVTSESLQSWVLPEHPLHPAYEYLSAVHRSDYLRPYFMHFHGGGYSDVKRQSGSWIPTVEAVLESRRLIGAGYREVRGGTVRLERNVVAGGAFILGRRVPRYAAKAATDIMRAARPLLIGNGAYYFRPRTHFTRRWLAETERRLDLLLPALRERPATHPRDRLGDPSGYPVPWSFLLGDILGPLSLLNFGRLLRTLPPPNFVDYL